jgi:hypothetical protein
MKHDLLAVGGGFLAIGVFLWAIWGDPEIPKPYTAQQIVADPELKLISEQNLYMRNER